MAFLSRKQAVDDANVTDEAQVDYLDAPDTVGRPMALVSIILIVLLIAALLFASFGVIRWLNNRNKANNAATSQTVTTDAPANGANEQTSGGDANQSTGNTGSGGTSNGGTAESNNQPNSGSATTATNNDASNQTSTADGSGATVPTAGGVDEPSSQNNASSTGQLPNTGASSNAIALFIVATFGGAFAYRIYLAKKLS